MKRFVFTYCFLLIVLNLNAQSTIEYQSSFLDSLLINLSDTSYNLETRLNILDTQIELKDKLIDRIKFKIDQIDKDFYNNQIYHERLSNQLEYEEKKYSDLIIQADKIRKSMYSNFDIFSFDNLYKTFNQYLYIKYLSDYRVKKIRRIKDIKNEIANVLIKLEDIKSQQNILAEKLGVEKSFIAKYTNNRSSIIAQLKKSQSFQQSNTANDVLNSQNIQHVNSDTTQQDNLLFEVQKGYLDYPVKNAVIISTFGDKQHPVYDNVTIRNDGVNFLVPEFSNVKVVYSGVVSKIVSLPTNQYAIIVRHGSYFTVYSGLDHIKVSAGDNVNKNDIIGDYENFKDKLILNFQIWFGTEKLNPQHWLKKNK
ncbi:MAG: peptidoglycan DD-metalloendopeptidase family protein [Bacteroidales bacterium]|nr:peptidoglycan DD-metalloendopeptidase family protein [Bacteroidales bacterium]